MTDRVCLQRSLIVLVAVAWMFAATEASALDLQSATRAQSPQRGFPITGVLIGAAVGAVPGIYFLIVDPNECTGMCPEEYRLIAVGAIVGGLIDDVISRKVAISPLVTRHRKIVRLTLKF
jgi:hypothetical protein